MSASGATPPTTVHVESSMLPPSGAEYTMWHFLFCGEHHALAPLDDRGSRAPDFNAGLCAGMGGVHERAGPLHGQFALTTNDSGLHLHVVARCQAAGARLYRVPWRRAVFDHVRRLYAGRTCPRSEE